MKEYTLAQLTRLCGAKRRQVQIMAEAGALKADPITERGGSGIHRKFGQREAIIACILGKVTEYGITIGTLITIADGIRKGYLNADTPSKSIYEAMEGRMLAFLVIPPAGQIILWSEGVGSLENTLERWPSSIVVNLKTCLQPLRVNNEAK
jgi:hypothetical protein